MKRWNNKQKRNIENKKIDVFLEEITKVYKKHGFAISHEDAHGGFEIVNIEDGYLDWLMDASDDTGM